MKSWWQWSSLLCHSLLFLASDYSFQKTLSLQVLMLKVRRTLCHSLPSSTQTWMHKNMGMLLSLQHQSSDMFNHMNLYVMDTGLCCYSHSWSCFLQPTCIVNHCQVHKGSVMTHELWLVAVHRFMQPPDMLRAALFGCYSNSIFSEGVMSPVLDLDKRKSIWC